MNSLFYLVFFSWESMAKCLGAKYIGKVCILTICNCCTPLYGPFLVEPEICLFFLLQGPGPSGKNEEKAQVLTEKIEDLVVQV